VRRDWEENRDPFVKSKSQVRNVSGFSNVYQEKSCTSVSKKGT
jgi:hypothetical protein